jgi:SAM-dependent methyltransferase
VIQHEVQDASIRIDDLHPDATYPEEQRLAEDFVRFKAPPSPPGLEPCPVCGSARHEIFFQRFGRDYALCPRTWTVALASEPDPEVLTAYFQDSDLARFRASETYQLNVAKRRAHLWDSQIEWVRQRLRRHLGPGRFSVLDWGPKAAGRLPLVAAADFVSDFFVMDPLPPLAPRPAQAPCDVVLLFDALQRFWRPAELLRRINDHIRPGGLLFLTLRSGSGFDVLTLGGRNTTIFPFDHVSLPSVAGLRLLADQAGFEVLELTTPGQLDVSIVEQSRDSIPLSQYFQRYVMSQCDEAMQERLQAFLQRNNLSSHIQAVVRKKP